MMSSSTPDYPAHKLMLHLYVPDVFKTYQRALAMGVLPIEEPVRKEDDPDVRGAFYDPAGNYWAIGMQYQPGA